MNKKSYNSNTMTDKITVEQMLPPVVFSQLCKDDQKKAARLRQNHSPYSNDKHEFYRMVMDPYKTVCAVISRIGGNGHYGFRDGHKYMCMEDLAEDIRKGECLIYSFGVAKDLTFEEQLGAMGCKVYIG